MSYDYKETSDEIIIDKGIATREMWKEYDHGKEFVSFEELRRAVELRNRVPLVLDRDHNHQEALTDAAKAVGYADLRPCPDKRGLSTTWHFRKDKLPHDLLERLRRREQLPVSIYQFVNVGEDREQRDLLFDHIAILANEEPRCPIERCGVGVYDSKMSDEEKFTDSSDTPVTESKPVQSEQKETKEAPKPVDKPEPEPSVPDALQVKEAEISQLQAELEKAKAQLKDVRTPLTDELVKRGYQLQELNPLSISTLQKMVDQSRAASTEGLPGTVPAPSATTPKTLAEQREAEQQRFNESLKKRQDERFKDW